MKDVEPLALSEVQRLSRAVLDAVGTVVVGKLRFVQETDPTAYPAKLGPGETSVAVSRRLSSSKTLPNLVPTTTWSWPARAA